MKKIFILLVFIIFSIPVYARENWSFIYINGANNNDKRMKNWYENGVHRVHYFLRNSFLYKEEVKNYFSKKGGLNIEQNPVIFFWGYESFNDLNYVKKQIKLTKRFSALGAYFTKLFFTENIHDAIWIQKPNNMIPVIEDLDKTVKTEIKKGNDIVLYGYSAGAFVAYEYLFNKLTFISPEELFLKMNADKDIINFVKKHKIKNTCLSALSPKYANILSLNYSNKYILNEDKSKFKANYLKLNEMTQTACIPENRFKGVVYFGNPMTLFYSDLFDDSYDLNFYNSLLIKYILENGIFMLTVNFREDPLGFSLTKNMPIDEIETHLNMKINNPSGVIYNNSDVWAFRPFIIAHQCYWSRGKKFAKAVVKSLINGYKFQYDIKYQKKIKSEHKKESGL